MAQITLYKNSKILEENNFVVEGIENYLSNFSDSSKLFFNNAQYIKQGLNTEIKIVMSQDNLDKSITNNYNYASIKNPNGENYYYYIREKIWTSSNCVKLILRLDVLNTFNGKYELTSKTSIIREHKNRIEAKVKQGHTQSFSIYADDVSWGWHNEARIGQVGTMTFELSEEFKGRKESEIHIEVGRVSDYSTFINDNVLTIVLVFPLSIQIPHIVLPIAVSSQRIVEEPKRIIDEISEGIETILFNKNEMEILGYNEGDTDSTGEYLKDSNSYLIYKAHNSFNTSESESFIYKNPIDCFYATNYKNEYIVNSGITIDLENDIDFDEPYFITFNVVAGSRILPNSFEQDFPILKDGNKVRIYYLTGTSQDVVYNYLTSVHSDKINKNRFNQRAFVFWKKMENGVPKYFFLSQQLARNNYATTEFTIGEIPNGSTKLFFENVSNVKATKTKANWISNRETNWNWVLIDKENGSVNFTNSTKTTKTTKSYEEIDDTNQQLVKIIKFPYPVYKLAGVKDELDWNEQEQLAKVNTSKLKSKYIEQNIEDSDENYALINDTIKLKTFSPSLFDLRDDYFESKLFHSDFHHFTFTYDSFTYEIRNEFIDELEYNEGNQIKMIIPTSVSSAFLFDFSNIISYKQSLQSYPYILQVNRNNEMPIYNNYYLNYMRSGALNADIKANQNSKVISSIGAGLGIAQTGIGIALSATGYGSSFGVPMIVSGVATTAASLTSAIGSSINADRNLQQKIRQAQQQSASVEGSEDIGLLTYYTNGNRAKWVEWEVSDITKKRIADLFYYCGYKCNYQEIPNTNSRKWFNFVQCNPVFKDNEFMSKMGKDCKEELSNKYNQGITFLHNINNQWDFEQQLENWEVDLFQ